MLWEICRKHPALLACHNSFVVPSSDQEKPLLMFETSFSYFIHLGAGFWTFRPQTRVLCKIRPRVGLQILEIEDLAYVMRMFMFHIAFLLILS